MARIGYVDAKAISENREGAIHLGIVQATLDSNDVDWRLSTDHRQPIKIDRGNSTDKTLSNLVNQKLDGCLPRAFTSNGPDSEWDQLKWLTLCAMRVQTGADVAMIQKRDLFQKIPDDATINVQQLLDRVIWKGDLLTLLYVPGSALKKALDQSKKYDDEDANLLSLADETKRGLEFLGARKDGKNWIINELPLDEKKIYAVATSDYIGAGDTGYPDFQSAALRQKTRPDQFPDHLVTISSVVCRTLYDNMPSPPCTRDIITGDYLDETIAQAPPKYVRPGFGSKLWELFPFKLAPKHDSPANTQAALQEKTEQRPIWMFSLKNLGISFSGLNNNLSDADIAKKFAGVKSSGVTAKKAQSITSALDLRLSRMSHTGGLFETTTIDYKRQSTGDVAPRISQINNLVTSEVGYLRNLWGGRSEKSMGASFSLYSETQLQRPFANFTLGTGETIKISQDRSLMLLPRIGLFWRNGTTNAFAAGVQAGRELHSLVGYNFITPSGTFECLPQVDHTFADCIKDFSPRTNPKITPDSTASPILASRPRAGFYWKSGFTLPINSKMSYVFSDKGDFFFNFSNDNATDTRYRDESKHSLKFTIWPSFSIGPSLRMLLYKNKVNRDFLFQKEFGFETSFAFDVFNRREKGVQVKHKP